VRRSHTARISNQRTFLARILIELSQKTRDYLIGSYRLKQVIPQWKVRRTELCSVDRGNLRPSHIRMLADACASYASHNFHILGYSGMVRGSGNRNKGAALSNRSCSRRISQAIEQPYEMIDWHCDFDSGYKWNSKKWYKSIYPKIGADIKVPWELARFQHLPQMAVMYGIARHGTDVPNHLSPEVLLCEFRNQVLDFIRANPPRFGVNWVCTMEVAIRVANWLFAYDIFRNNGAEFDSSFMYEFLRSVLQHGLHIANNLEYSKELTSNHYLSNLAGLLFVAAHLPEYEESSRWYNFAAQELVKEMEKQVYDDGTDFEASTCYHRLVLEIFFYSTWLATICDSQFSGENYAETARNIFGEKYVRKLYKMFDAVHYLLKPDGKMPQIGDNDSGQFIKLYPRETLDMIYLLALGAVFFDESKWKLREYFCVEDSTDDIPEVVILYGGAGKQKWDMLEWSSVNDIKSKAFDESGWYVMRHGNNYCIVSCGPNGQNGNGGHCHNDKLSFELCLDGKDIIIDPGTYVYTPKPEWRNKFRSTVSHNTVMVNEKEQNILDKRDLFRLEDNTIAKCMEWEISDDVDIFVGKHYGYKYLPETVIHQREIKFHKKEGKLLIVDKFNGTGICNLKWVLILAPESGCRLEIGSQLKWQKIAGYYSPAYGIRCRTERYEASGSFRLPFETQIQLSTQSRGKRLEE